MTNCIDGAPFPILHGAEMWKRGHNNLIRDALVFIPFKVGNDRRETEYLIVRVILDK